MQLKIEEAKKVYADLLRHDLSTFIERTFYTVDPNATYLHNWHIDLIADYLMACHRMEIKRLIINVPPGYLKSISVNVAFPAWILGKDPTERILSTSKTEAISKEHSIACRDVISSEWYRELFPNTTLRTDQSEKLNYYTTEGGRRQAVSFNGNILGKGGNILIVDDPHGAEEVQSQTTRVKSLEWYEQQFIGRMRDKKNGVMLIIMQRLHQEDLCGYLLEKGGYEHLCLPATAPLTHVVKLGRHKGMEIKKDQILHPEREGPEELEQRKREMGSYAYAGQYEQTPVPKGGGMLKREWLVHYNNVTPEQMNRGILCDSANSKGKNSDYTCFMVIGLGQDRNYYVLEIVRDRLNLKERTEKLFHLHKKWTLNNITPQFVGYEKYGKDSDIEHIQSEQERLNYRFYITPLNDAGKRVSKEARIERLVPLFNNKNIWLPEYGQVAHTIEGVLYDPVKAFVDDEYVNFPYSKHDDMLDALAKIKDDDFILDFPMYQESYDRQGRYFGDGSGDSPVNPWAA
jgi:predicted phage terminase large subunit-like protein